MLQITKVFLASKKELVSMSIWKMCQAYLQERRQKGQIIVFTAVLLPFIIAMCGLTVDFGNMYVHKSKLQNAADAAAIAGAYAYAENGENKDNFPYAKAASQNSLNANLPNTTLASVKRKPISGDDGKIYYCVKISENVPIYFLRLFNVGDTAEVAADAYASITSSSGGGGIFDNLFTFGKYVNKWWSGDTYGFVSVQANEASLDEPISQSSIYEGKIKFIGNETDMLTDYRHELLNKAALDAFKAKRITTVGEAIEKNYFTKPKADTSTKLDSELDGILNIAKDNHANTNKHWDNSKTLSSIISNEVSSADGIKKNYVYYDSNNNARLYVDINLEKGTDPFYVVIDSQSTVFLNITNKTIDKDSRPIVYVYTGTETINIEAQNSFFHGIIYAPNAPIHMNDAGMNFYGSIAALGIQLKQKAYYEIDTRLSQYFGGGSGSGSGSSGTGTTSIGLVSPPSNISWD